jgi:hypothetical protein
MTISTLLSAVSTVTTATTTAPIIQGLAADELLVPVTHRKQYKCTRTATRVNCCHHECAVCKLRDETSCLSKMLTLARELYFQL